MITGADSVACIQLWSLHEQCHHHHHHVTNQAMSSVTSCVGGVGGSLLYLLACALQYRYLDNNDYVALHYMLHSTRSGKLHSGANERLIMSAVRWQQQCWPFNAIEHIMIWIICTV
jgi:hypothetical protein